METFRLSTFVFVSADDGRGVVMAVVTVTSGLGSCIGHGGFCPPNGCSQLHD